MKFTLIVQLLGVLSVVWSCGQKSRDQEEGNQGLYDEVMKVHDEVMPKMNSIYKLREELKKQLTTSPDMAQEKKKSVEQVIIQLDSASESMMIWMRNFNPLPDSSGVDEAREYLLGEKEKVNNVKEGMLKAIDKANAIR